MKKLKLNPLQLNAKEVLTREQLKNVMGGTETGSGHDDGSCTETCGTTETNKVTCSSSTGDCSRSSINAWIACDGHTYNCPTK